MDRPYTIYCNFCKKEIQDITFRIVCDCEGFIRWQEDKMKEWEDLNKPTKKENNPELSGFKSEAVDED